MSEKKMVKKYMIGLWIDKSEDSSLDWLRVKKSEEMDLALNPEIVERDYIVDEFPTQEIDKYKPALNQSLTMYKGEPDYEALFPMGYSLPTGAKAKRGVLIVFMQEPVAGSPVSRDVYTKADAYEAGTTYYSESGGVYTEEAVESQQDFDGFSGDLYTKETVAEPGVVGYKAWKTEATLSFTNINGKESKLTFDINFGGTIEKGYATPDASTKKPVFTRTENDDEGWVDPFGGN